jgi:hypothetical protein
MRGARLIGQEGGGVCFSSRKFYQDLGIFNHVEAQRHGGREENKCWYPDRAGLSLDSTAVRAHPDGTGLKKKDLSRQAGAELGGLSRYTSWQRTTVNW